MKKQVRVRPGRGQSAVGAVVGVVFVLLGVFMVIPAFGPFGVFWTLIATVITAVNLLNAFSQRGVASCRIEIDEADAPEEEPIERRLERLRGLYEQRLISEEEYQKKKAELLKEL